MPARRIGLLLVRWSGLLMAVALAFSGLWVETAVAMLVALAQVVGWRTRLPRAWEVATSLTCLIAAGSSYLLLYELLPWWDLPVHFTLNGLLSVLVARVVGNRDLRTGQIFVTGTALAVVWELMELWGHHMVDPCVEVRPADTATDILAGILGTLAAAWLWHRRRGAGPRAGCREERHGDRGAGRHEDRGAGRPGG